MANFYGKDTKFPINNSFKSIEGVDLVLQDMQLLLLTVPGERLHRPTYGCRLFTRIWDNIDVVASEGLTDIREALNEFEPRINLLRVNSQIIRNVGQVIFTITFTLIGENNPRNLVFPFNTQVNV